MLHPNKPREEALALKIRLQLFFLATFISNGFPFSKELGTISRIDYQVRSDGWLLDDLLIALENKNKKQVKVAVSIKSNTQFNSKGASNELIYDLWNQYLNDETKVFNQTEDYLCVVNSPLSSTLSANINNLINASKKVTSLTLDRRIQKAGFSKGQKAIYDSFCCPEGLAAKHNISKSDTGKLLSKLILLEFDFESNLSKDENRIITICKECLSHKDPVNATKLFKRLSGIRSEFAPFSGFLDYKKLVDIIRIEFDLIGFPDHENDWRSIHKNVSHRLATISNKIGGKVVIDRTIEEKELNEKFNVSQFVFLLGRSGYGKSALAKEYIESKILEGRKIVWLDTQTLIGNDISHSYNLDYDLRELIEKTQDSKCYLIVDGLDRFFKEPQLNIIAELLITIQNSSHWKVLFTCQSEDFEDVLKRLYRLNVSLEKMTTHEMRTLKAGDFLKIQEIFSHLSELFKHVHLHELLSNLKYLDLLAYNISDEIKNATASSVGESVIIDLIWKEEIETVKSGNGSQNSRFLQLLGEKQGDNLAFGIPTSDFDISELAPVAELKTCKFILESEDQLFFNHDLFGDWARYKLIRGKRNSFKQFILSKDLTSPLWGKAIRLFGVYLLEKNDAAKSWIDVYYLFNDKEPKEKIIQDLLLESIVFSSSSLGHLEELWEDLKKDDGNMFTRFLERFLYKATMANPLILRLTNEITGLTVSEAATIKRNLKYAYWPDIIQFLYNHKLEVINIARKKVALITDSWLRSTPNNFPFRKESAEIAIENAQWIFDFKVNGGWVRDDVDKDIYRTFLAGVDQFPDEVIALALKLCKRKKFKRKKTKNIKGDHARSIFKSFTIREAIQWPDGPYERVDEDFSDICMNTDALYPLIREFPRKAKEIVLALLIEHPHDQHFGYDSSQYNFEITEPSKWFPPFYNRGPFLYFLETHPNDGLDLVIRLVNFATENWTNNFKHKGEDIPFISIEINNEPKKFIGDNYVYYWFRDVGHVPHSLVSLLMALEKFFINRMDKGQDISQYVDTIISKGNSLAFIGLLNSMGRYKPELYLTVLKPFLGVLDFYYLERSLDYGAYNIEGHQMMGSNFYDSTTRKLAKEWNDMPHRRKSLQQVILILSFNNQQINDHMKKVTDSWKKELDIATNQFPADAYVSNLLGQFDKKNYSVQKIDNGAFLVYNEPKEVTEQLVEARQNSEKDMRLSAFPFKCFQGLENNIQHSIEEIENIWEIVQEAILLEESDPYSHMAIKYQCIMGGFAVLINNKKVWIDTHPEFLNRILTYTEGVIENSTINIRDLSMIDIGYSWNSFCVKFMPLLWQEKLDDKRIKRMIGLLVLRSSYNSIQSLFGSISKRMEWSNPRFINLQNLLLKWSIGIHKYQMTIRTKTPFDLNTYCNNILEEFIREKGQPQLIDWVSTDTDKTYKKTKAKYWDHEYDNEDNIHKRRGLDLELVHYAFSSLPDLDEKTHEKEYRYTLTFWKKMIHQIILQLGEIKEDSNPIKSYPKDADIWIVKKLSSLILYVKESDSPDQYWKPIFEYGGLAHHWVERFALYFFLMNLDKKNKYDAFFEAWNKMLEFANTSNRWKVKRHHAEYGDMWYSLIGLSNSLLNVWDDDYVEFMTRANKPITTWIAARFNDQRVIERLLYLLRKKSGEIFIRDGLILINTHLQWQKKLKQVGAPNGYVLVEFEHNDSLARTASFLWEKHKESIRAESKMFEAFKDIVIYLVSIQNTIGLEIQDKIVSS